MSYLTTVLFFAIFLALLWVNLRHGILPDRLTFGGVLAGWILSFAYPGMHRQASGLGGLSMGILGAVAGYLFTWACCELGKQLFGTKTIRFPQGREFVIHLDSDDMPLTIEDETVSLSDCFLRKTDRLHINGSDISIDTTLMQPPSPADTISLSCNTVWAGRQELFLKDVKRITGICHELRLPREAMGFGVVKMMAFVGAFLGWSGALCILAGSLGIVGIFALLSFLIARGNKPELVIQFSPHAFIATLVYLIVVHKSLLL